VTSRRPLSERLPAPLSWDEIPLGVSPCRSNHPGSGPVLEGRGPGSILLNVVVPHGVLTLVMIAVVAK
jgi:hypothetical protein